MIAGTEHLASRDLAAFARANGWDYEPTGVAPALGESLWEQVSNGVVSDKVVGQGWEAGRITGGERSASRVEQRGAWTVTTSVSVSTPRASIDLGYLAIELPRRMPHLVLDAVGNDRGPFSSLLNKPTSSQRMSLEGDFDRHFRLYAPSGYETDALYVFTPDFMALLIDESGDLDVEIRDDRLIVYRPGGFDLFDPAVWIRFEQLRAVLGAKAWDRTRLYTDDRALPGLAFEGSVGAEGQRLRRRLPGFVWILVAVPVVILVVGGIIVATVLSR